MFWLAIWIFNILFSTSFCADTMSPLKKVDLEKDPIKQTAFSMMDQLEGWCSHEKASILIDLIFQTHTQIIVEIGVFGGKSLIPMAYALKVQGSGRIFGIDPWDHRESAHGLTDEIHRNWWGNLDHGPILDTLRDKIDAFELKEQIQLIQNSSAGAEPIEEIDLLHIDGNHAEEHSFYDVLKWGPLVKKRGWIVFDDIGWEDNGADASACAVQWLNDHCIKYAEFVDSSIWGIWVKQ
jgi:predicted O-methyltransferase YrrM